MYTRPYSIRTFCCLATPFCGCSGAGHWRGKNAKKKRKIAFRNAGIHPTIPPVLSPGEPLWVYALLASPFTGRLWANMTSFTKPEVHNVLHYRQRTTEPWRQLTHTENSVKSQRAIFQTCELTDIQTDTETRSSQYFRIPTRGEVKKVQIHTYRLRLAQKYLPSACHNVIERRRLLTRLALYCLRNCSIVDRKT